MGELDPVAFDIETSGFGEDAVVTVIGFAHDICYWLALNTAERDTDQTELQRALAEQADRELDLAVYESEAATLDAADEFVDSRLDGDTHYVTAFNGETWQGGFDLPFLRSAYLRHDADWPFGDIAYADMMPVMDRFDTNDASDLVGVYDALVGDTTCDPFNDSAAAVDAFERGDWQSLLEHNLADVKRTHELAKLAGRFVPASDFSMKNLEPPNQP
jgi:hypothetical protein